MIADVRTLAVESGVGAPVKVLLFNVGRVQCGLPLAEVREVMRPMDLERNPSLPSCVLGTCMIRDLPTPVIDVAALLGTGASSPTRFITVSVGDRQAALAVDAVFGASQVDAQMFHAATPLVCGDGEAVSALAVRDNQLVYLLNSARLLPVETPDSRPPVERSGWEPTKRRSDAG